MDMRIGWGKAKSFQLEIRDASQSLVDLTGKTIRFSAKASSDDADPALISKETGSGIVHNPNQTTTGKGLATLTLLPTDTSALLASVAGPERLASLVAELDLIQNPGQPEKLDSGFLLIEPVVRRSV